MEMLSSALITAIGLIWLMSWLNLRRIAGYGFLVDAALTGLLMYLFHGTYAGMVTGMFAGVFVSLFIRGVKRVMGYERLELARKQGEKVAKPRWVRYNPTLR